MNNWPNTHQGTSSNLLTSAPLTQNFTPNASANISSNSSHTFKSFPELPKSNQTISVTSGMRINDAIEKASDYSTIIIESGKYLECIRVTKPLYFQANGKVSLRSDGINECVIVSSPFVSFTGFSIKQKSSRIRGSVKIISGAVILHNCVFKTLSMATIQVQNDSIVQMKNCKVYGSKSPALQALNKSQIEAFDTAFSNSTTTIINITNEAFARFSNCAFNESRNGGVVSSESSFLLVENSTFDHSMIEFRSDSSECFINNCTLGNDSLIKTNNNCSNISITKNNLTNSTIQIDGNSTSILNSNRYNNSSLIIRSTTTATVDNETFTGNVEYTIRVMENAKCSIKNSCLSSITGLGIVSYGNCLLSIENCQFINISGNAIIGHSGCDVTISNITFQSLVSAPIVLNSVIQASLARIRFEGCNGNGCEINGCEKNVKISECLFHSNQKCGLVLSNNLNGIVIDGNTTFVGNGFSGIHSSHSALQITNGVFQQNKKCAIFVSDGSRVVVVGSSFTNGPWSAIHVDNQSQIQVDSSIFQNNDISLNIDGIAEISRSKFDSNMKNAAIQVSGKGSVNGCEFTNNKCPVIVAGQGSLSIEKSVFTSSQTHIETLNNGQCQCIGCQFSKATGDSAINVTGQSLLSLQKCSVTENNLIGIASDANTTILDSVISNSGKIGLLCNQNATGEIRKNEISNNGESAVLCAGGTLKILENNIINNGKFGIYIASKVSPSVENNTFSSNNLAHIWHTE